MDNRTYWEKRAEIRELRAYSNCLEATNGLVNAYRRTAADIRREINDFYNRFANENGLTYADAVRYLNREEALEWRTSVEGYINEIRQTADEAVRERLMREYDARAYGARITRLESLSGDIDTQLSRLYARANEQFRQLLGENFTEGYYRTIFDIQNRHGYNSMFAAVNPQMVENALTYPWSGANFSERLWKHKGELLNTLRETLTRGLIRGDSVQDMAKRLSECLNASRANAMRLMRTESSHIHNIAELEAYKACGFDEYEFMASVGERTCEVCGGLDGQRFKLADKQFGVNFPPVHPNCRCTTIAYDPDDNLEDMKSGELDYDQWYEKYVEGREQPRIDSREGAEIELPANTPAPAPVLSGGNVNTAVQTLTRGEDSGIIKLGKFRTVDDPMREVTGPALISNPKEIESIINDLNKSGVELIYTNHDMAYAPGTRIGSPGQFLIDKNASYSAWCHEYKHFCDDRDDGFLGFSVFQDVAKCRQREIDAYQIEIELAERAKRPDIVERLKNLRDKEVAKYE